MTDQTTQHIHDAYINSLPETSRADGEQQWNHWLEDHHFTPQHTLPTPPAGYTYADTDNGEKRTLDPDTLTETRDAIGLAWDTVGSALGILEHLRKQDAEGPAGTLLADSRSDLQCAAGHIQQALLLLGWTPDEED